MLSFYFLFSGVVNVYAQVGQVQQGLSSGGTFKLSNGNETTTVCFYLKNGDDGAWRRSALTLTTIGTFPMRLLLKLSRNTGKSSIGLESENDTGSFGGMPKNIGTSN